MTIHSGFDDLKESRRGSLLRIASRVGDRHHRTAGLLAAMTNDRSFSADTIGIASNIRDCYLVLAETIRFQFPEIRADHSSALFGGRDAWNTELLDGMRAIDKALATKSGIGVRTLTHWLEDEDSIMPAPNPLFSSEVDLDKVREQAMKPNPNRRQPEESNQQKAVVS